MGTREPAARRDPVRGGPQLDRESPAPLGLPAWEDERADPDSPAHPHRLRAIAREGIAVG